MNQHLLLNVRLIVHISAENSVLDELYNRIRNLEEFLSLGRREDLLRIDDIQFVELNEYEIDSDAEDDEEDEDIPKKEKYNLKHSIYIPKTYDVEFDGISYRSVSYTHLQIHA